LFGIDVNRELVKSTQELLGRNINISVQDATNLKFSDECFDYAIEKALLIVLVSDFSIKKCLREAYRVLKFGGILFRLKISFQIGIWNYIETDI